VSVASSKRLGNLLDGVAVGVVDGFVLLEHDVAADGRGVGQLLPLPPSVV